MKQNHCSLNRIEQLSYSDGAKENNPTINKATANVYSERKLYDHATPIKSLQHWERISMQWRIIINRGEHVGTTWLQPEKKSVM